MSDMFFCPKCDSVMKEAVSLSPSLTLKCPHCGEIRTEADRPSLIKELDAYVAGMEQHQKQRQAGQFLVRSRDVISDQIKASEKLTARPAATGIEAEVCQDIARRQHESFPHYGTTVGDSPLPLTEWIKHAYHELLDGSIYLKKAGYKLIELLNQIADRDAFISEVARLSDTDEIKIRSLPDVAVLLGIYFGRIAEQEEIIAGLVALFPEILESLREHNPQWPEFEALDECPEGHEFACGACELKHRVKAALSRASSVKTSGGWSSTVPTVPGWYWLKAPNLSARVVKAWMTSYGPRHDYDNDITKLYGRPFQFCGPLPLPPESSEVAL